MECGWNTGSEGLLAAFQDLKTITNEIEVHEMTLREVVEQTEMFSIRDDGDD